MKTISRRSFVKYSGTLMALSHSNFFPGRKMPLIAFSTLGCPDWPLDKILEVAVANRYDGIEIRGILREMDLTKSPHFNNEENIKTTRRKFEDKNLKMVGFGSSAAMHHPGGAEKTKAMDEAKRFLELASKAGCPYVRVFPNNYPKDVPKEKTVGVIATALNELADFAREMPAKIVMETHGDLVWSDDLMKIMEQVHSDKVGLVWDVSNMWTVTKEDPALVLTKLKKWIWHTHIKDIKFEGDKQVYTLLGEGDVPAFGAIDLLEKNQYKGYYSFEWEKMWHPEIAEPELAIPHYAQVMKKHFTT